MNEHLDIDKMNDCLAAGLKDIRVESYNDRGWDIIINQIWTGHSLPANHPAFKAVINDMHKNSKRKNPKSHFENYRIPDFK